MSNETILVEVEEFLQVVDVQVENNTSVIDVNISTTGVKGDKGEDGYTPIKGVDYFDGVKGDKGDTGAQGLTGATGIQGAIGPDGYTPVKGVDYVDGDKGDKGDKGDPGTTDWNDITNPPNLSIYAEKSNVLERNGADIFTPDGDYQPATKKYVDDHVGTPAGNDTAIQFNDNGVFGGVDAFKYDRVSGAITVGESVEVLPNTPLAIEKDIDDYVQVTFQNKSDSMNASMDIVITADNGDDETHYLDIGVNSSQYSDPDYAIIQANDTYIDASDDNLLIGTGGTGKVVRLYAGGHTVANISADIDENGINLPTGKTFRINGTAIGSAPDFLSLTDAPSSYTGQAGKAVTVNPEEDGLVFTNISGLGDMKVSVYDPNSIADDVFNTDNHVSGVVNRVYSVSEQAKLSGIATGAEVNVQSDWNEIDTGADAFIKNKPTIPSGLTPSTTVVSETSYGQGASVGTSLNYAREDHTHGTPAGGSGISESQAIALACALGGL